MNYLNDLSQTGVDEKKRLISFWPWSNRMVLQLTTDLPEWTRMLQDGQVACCFAVTVGECLEYSGDVSRHCEWSGSRRNKSIAIPSKGPLLSTIISLYGEPPIRLPLRPAGIMKMDAGCLTIVGEHREGHARLAKFWRPNVLDRTNELLDASDGERRGALTHAEFLDRARDTGKSVAVCIVDRRDTQMFADVCTVDWRDHETALRAGDGIIMRMINAFRF